MVALFYAVELEILESLDAPGRGDSLAEAAQAYRARSRCLEALGQTQRAKVDAARADRHDAEAKKLAKDLARGSNQNPASGQSVASNASEKGSALGRLRLVNNWTESVTVVVDGARYRLTQGEQRIVERPAGSFSYEVEAAGSRGSATVEPGETFTLRVRSR
jgi:hypothetical protein